MARLAEHAQESTETAVPAPSSYQRYTNLSLNTDMISDASAISPTFGGPSDQACELGDVAGGVCGDGESVKGDVPDRTSKGMMGSPTARGLPSPLHKPWQSPSMSPKRAPTTPKQNRLQQSNSFACMAHLSLSEELSEEKEDNSESHESEAHRVPSGVKDGSCQSTGESWKAVGGSFKSAGTSEHHHILEHTIGTVKLDANVIMKHEGASEAKGLRRAVSETDMHHMVSDEDSIEDEEEDHSALIGSKLLVVLDMDHTMVGNLVALSDRDNIEVNIEWEHWPAERERGLSKDDIIPFLKRGMLRPGLKNFITYLAEIGATIVVYTHSELRWASKVCAAMEEVIGIQFIKRLFARHDCMDGHPEFLAKKSLEFIVDSLREQDGLSWVSADRAIMFDDDKNALFAGEKDRLVVVPSYDYWEPCQWDEIITEELLEKNPEDVVDLVRRTVVEWGIAPPSYRKDILTQEDVKIDEMWALQRSKKHDILMSYNKVSKLDRMWANVQHAMSHIHEFDNETLSHLPSKVMRALGGGLANAKRSIF